MNIAKIIGKFFNHLFGKKSKPVEKLPLDSAEFFNDSEASSSASVEGNVIVLIAEDDDDCCEDDKPEPEFSRKEIMAMVKAMIKSENKQNPIYDTEIHAELSKAGVDLTRRSISYYRKEMDIDSRNDRKEDYAKEAERRKKKSKKRSNDSN